MSLENFITDILNMDHDRIEKISAEQHRFQDPFFCQAEFFPAIRKEPQLRDLSPAAALHHSGYSSSNRHAPLLAMTSLYHQKLFFG